MLEHYLFNVKKSHTLYFVVAFCIRPFDSQFTKQIASRRAEPIVIIPHIWYVYILKCADGTFYTGTTTDVSRRVKEHNRKKGGACTRARLPVTPVYKEIRKTRSSAQKRESQIKGWARKKKLALIEDNLELLKDCKNFSIRNSNSYPSVTISVESYAILSQ